MTAYLKPGDRVFFTYPGEASPARNRENSDALRRILAEVGVSTFGSMEIIGKNAKFEIVAVVRDE